MAKYWVKIEYSNEFEVEADSEQDARDKGREEDKYLGGDWNTTAELLDDDDEDDDA